MTTHNPPRRKRSTLSRILRALTIAALLLILLAAGALFLIDRQTARPPAWWDQAGATAPDAPDVAAAVERGVTTVVHKPRDPDTTWQVEVTQAQLNAWFAHRFEQWMANQGEAWPDAAGHPRLALEPARVLIGVPLGGESSRRVVSASFLVNLDAEGALGARLHEVRIGNLAVPMGVLHAAITQAVGDAPEAAAAIEALLTGGPLLDDPSITLEDGRRVTLVALTIHDNRLVATCRTDPP